MVSVLFSVQIDPHSGANSIHVLKAKVVSDAEVRTNVIHSNSHDAITANHAATNKMFITKKFIIGDAALKTAW